MRTVRTFFFLICWSMIFIPSGKLFANAGDSLLPVSHSTAASQRVAKNYIRPCIYMNYFSTGSRQTVGKLDPFHDKILDNKLGLYRFAQSNVGLYVPLYTHTKFVGADSSTMNTFHLLMTMNGLSDMPQFSHLTKQHQLYKIGAGIRMIYGFGSKFVLFYDANPYVVGDKFDSQQTQQFRFASSLVFNFMVSPSLSFRIGATRTFLFGNKYYLPMAGVRIGKLDSKFYVSLQFPRYISFNFQPTSKFSFDIYSRAYGGLYNISNGDSIYPFGDKVIQFGQHGLANGIRFDFRTGPNFSFFVSTGFSVNNTIWFYSSSFNQQHHERPLAPFYKGRPDPSGFINVGLTLRFGKSKKTTGNYLMYDIMSLNNDMDPGDNNSGAGNGDITPEAKKKEMQKVQYKDVVDLIDDTDVY